MEQLEQFKRPWSRTKKYDWDRIMVPGSVWRLVEGEDYQSVVNFRQGFFYQANVRGLTGRTYTEVVGDKNTLVVTTAPKGTFDRWEREHFGEPRYREEGKSQFGSEGAKEMVALHGGEPKSLSEAPEPTEPRKPSIFA